MKQIVIALGLVFLLAIVSFAESTEKTVKLTIYDRITLTSILPARASFDRVIVISDIREKVQLTQEDLEKYGITGLPTGGVAWNEEGATYEIEVSFTAIELEVLGDALKEMDRKKEMPTTKRFLELYRKIK